MVFSGIFHSEEVVGECFWHVGDRLFMLRNSIVANIGEGLEVEQGPGGSFCPCSCRLV